MVYCDSFIKESINILEYYKNVNRENLEVNILLQYLIAGISL